MSASVHQLVRAIDEFEAYSLEGVAADLARLISQASAADQLPALIMLLEVALAEAQSTNTQRRSNPR